ncbi:MAG: NAD(P)H-hydrate dehydratase [Arenicellales bacterium]
MNRLQDVLCSVSEVRELEAAQIANGVPAEALMESAGSSAFRLLRQCWPQAEQIAVYCGGGNNGGDGYVVAGRAAEAGLRVNLVALAPPSTPEAEGAKEKAQAAGVQPIGHSSQVLSGADVVVDALLGIGVTGPLREPYVSAIREINQSPGARLAIDVPSGLNADSGAAFPCAVSADVTITFIRNKRGLFTGSGPDCGGTIVLEPLGVGVGSPRAQQESGGWGLRLSEDWVKQVLPFRHASFHKGNAGHLLIIGGGPGMPGAASLAGRAALRSGAGRVTIVCHPDNRLAVSSYTPELMVVAPQEHREVVALLDQSDAVVIGPGLGRSEWAKSLYVACRDHPLPKVLDADALNLLSSEPVPLPGSVMTPHPGEAARLSRLTVVEVQSDRPAVADTLACNFDSVCVLKGAGTLVVETGKQVLVCDRGHPGMATAGMGDVLSGVIGALLGQGVNSYEAAGAGTWIHAVAGDLAGARADGIGLMATDLEPYLDRLRTIPPSGAVTDGR